MIPVCLALFTCVLMKTVLLFGYVPTASMEPTLPEGSYILGLRLYGQLEKGDIIIFRHDDKLLVKRIAAVAGEEIHWNAFTYAENILRPVRETDVTVVPENCYLVLGDNMENSYDSRYWSEPFIRAEEVTARLILPMRRGLDGIYGCE